jgi:hypothetical protein
MDHVKEMVSCYARVSVVRIVAIQNGSGDVLTLRITGGFGLFLSYRILQQ